MSAEMEDQWDSPAPPGPNSPRKRRGAPRLRLGAVLAVVVVIGFVAWLLVRGNGSSTPEGTGSTTTAHKTVAAISRQGLTTLAGSVGTPIYWAGPAARVRYELTQTPDGRYFVRYLPAGVPVGASKQYLFVATFPMTNAFAATTGVANRSNSVKVAVAGGVAFYSRSSPKNVYVAYPGLDYQIEVFDPRPQQARQLVTQGRIEPVAGSSQTTATVPTAVSLTQLKALPAKIGHPVYWAGAQPGSTYELTQTANGRIFIRYLPSSKSVGTTTQHLFVATFPLPGAFAATKGVANRADSVKIPLAGAVAFYSRSSPTNVYLAYPGSDYQIEVFDPNAAHARQLVRSGHVRAIP
jgi:hypothetical protein